MSEEQLSALLAKLKEDAGLLEKLKGAGDLDAAVAIAQEAGFDVDKTDWPRYQAKQAIELRNVELEWVVGGKQFQKGTNSDCMINSWQGCTADKDCFHN
jgi:predicted ribosomally synthesized peptide with nif11-like leader